MSVIISFSAWFQLKLFLAVPLIIYISATPGTAAPQCRPETKALSLEYCVSGLWSAANEVNGNSSCVVGRLVTSPSRVNGGRKTIQGKIWLVSFSGARYEPSVNREEMRSVRTQGVTFLEPPTHSHHQ